MSLTINAKLAQINGTPATSEGIFTVAVNENYNGYDCSWHGNLESFEIEYSVLQFYIDFNEGLTTSLDSSNEQWVTFNKNDTEEKLLYRDDWNRLEMIAYCSSWTSSSVQLNFIAKIDEEGYWSPDLLGIENPEEIKTLSRFGASLDNDLEVISNNINARNSSLQCRDIQCTDIEADNICCSSIVCDSIICDTIKTSFGAYYKIDFNDVDVDFTSSMGSIGTSSGKSMSFNGSTALASNEITVDTLITNLEKYFNAEVLKKNMYSTGFGCKIKCWIPKTSSENGYDQSSNKICLMFNQQASNIPEDVSSKTVMASFYKNDVWDGNDTLTMSFTTSGSRITFKLPSNYSTIQSMLSQDDSLPYHWEVMFHGYIRISI